MAIYVNFYMTDEISIVLSGDDSIDCKDCKEPSAQCHATEFSLHK